MKPLRYSSVLVLALMLLATGVALAADGRDCTSPVHTPLANGAVVTSRVFNDCPGSNLLVTNTYPSLISIRDGDDGCVGWANLHVWSFSEDGGISPAVFENCSGYRFSATVTLNPNATQGGAAEAGLRLSPWWSLDADGRFMVRAGAPFGNGEIACFGGRLPFYSFTANYGITYTNNTPATMEIIYNPHSLSAADPATITYNIILGGVAYSSGPLAFDQGNPAEDPPHGQYGELYQTRVGGYFQLPNGNGGAIFDWTCDWSDISYNDIPVPARSTSWGQLKTLYR